MAEKQHPHEKHDFSDHEQHVLTQLRPMMGGLDDEDKEVEARLQQHAEANAAKMKAARTGGSEGLGPTEAEQALVKQRGALQQQAASAGAQGAAQAQGGQSPGPTPPPAPSGPEGSTTPYSSQAGDVGGAGQVGGGAAAQPGPPPAPGGGEEQPPPEETA